jgi:hypothetical protein
MGDAAPGQVARHGARATTVQAPNYSQVADPNKNSTVELGIEANHKSANRPEPPATIRRCSLALNLLPGA